jgi:hypothetical protein
VTAPPGALVSIYYDARVLVAPGDAIVTTTGRTYVVVEARRQKRGAHVGRWHLRCLVGDELPPVGTTVHPLRWYKRARRAVSR